jgi:hypothetical protein
MTDGHESRWQEYQRDDRYSPHVLTVIQSRVGGYLTAPASVQGCFRSLLTVGAGRERCLCSLLVCNIISLRHQAVTLHDYE